MGLFSARARANASGPHGYQSTGLCACWSRYGDDSFASRFAAIANPMLRPLRAVMIVAALPPGNRRRDWATPQGTKYFYEKLLDSRGTANCVIAELPPQPVTRRLAPDLVTRA